MWSILTVGSLLLSLFLAGPASGQAAKPAADKPAVETLPTGDPLGRDSPHGAMLGFIRAADTGNYERAAQYLDTEASPLAASELARQLKSIVDRRLGTALIGRLSAQPEGRLDDDLPPALERVGDVIGGRASLTILLERIERPGQGPVWLVSAQTLGQVPMLHRELELSWIERLMPQPWREYRILALPLWQWILLLVAIPVVLTLAWVLHRLLLKGLRPLLQRLTGARADQQFMRMAAPLRLLTGAMALAIWASMTSLPLLIRVF